MFLLFFSPHFVDVAAVTILSETNYFLSYSERNVAENRTFLEKIQKSILGSFLKCKIQTNFLYLCIVYWLTLDMAARQQTIWLAVQGGTPYTHRTLKKSVRVSINVFTVVSAADTDGFALFCPNQIRNVFQNIKYLEIFDVFIY